MQIKIFTIPLGAEESMTEEMNHFLRANKIIDVKRELAVLNGNSCWSFCISYMFFEKSLYPLVKLLWLEWWHNRVKTMFFP